MKSTKILFKLLLITFLVFSCTSDDSNDNPNSENLDPSQAFSEIDVAYGDDPDQTFDLYLPAGRSEATKVLFLVHGGSWVAGDKDDMSPFVDLLRSEIPEIAIVNINYRLADQNNPPFPMQIDDISSIVEKLRDEKEYYVISDDLGFIGTSAGAHLSLLWSYAFDTRDQVDMTCSIVGPMNFTDPAYLENTDPILQEILDVFGMGGDTAFLEEVSPFHRATASSPPTILFYGGEDPLIPTSQGIDMRDKLTELGVTNSFTLYPEEGHGWTNPLIVLDTWEKLKSFINTHL